jgi:hypothetical protein
MMAEISPDCGKYRKAILKTQHLAPDRPDSSLHGFILFFIKKPVVKIDSPGVFIQDSQRLTNRLKSWGNGFRRVFSFADIPWYCFCYFISIQRGPNRIPATGFTVYPCFKPDLKRDYQGGNR